MNSVMFTAHGVPRPAGSKKGFPIKRKDGSIGVNLTDTSGKNGRIWRAVIQDAARQAMGDFDLMTGPLACVMVFNMPRPKKHYRTGKHAHELRKDAPYYHIVKPDACKLQRAVEDALTGIVWRDDSQVSLVYSTKIYKELPSVTVSIWGIEGQRSGPELYIGRAPDGHGLHVT